MTSLIDAESVLTVDVGSVNTRVLLFDVVDGQYHFVSSASAPSTARSPFYDVGEGFQNALKQLQEITGRSLIDNDNNLVFPSQSDGAGIDRLVVTFSVGDDIKIVTMGLLSDVSLESAERLVGTTYSKVVERIGLNDTRRPEAQLDAILQARPDIILVAGGTEKGATRSVFKLIELAGMASRITAGDNQPVIMYCGNSALSKRVKETLEHHAVIGVAPNIRPNIDQEDLDPAQTLLDRAVSKIRTRQISGFELLAKTSGAPAQPGAYAFGRMIRFMSEIYDPIKGVLGVDLGATTTHMAIGRAGNLQLSVFRPLGIGHALPAVLANARMEEIIQWIPQTITEATVRDYLYQKSVFPGTLPMTPETLAIEQAAARVILSTAIQRMQERWSVPHLSFDLVVAGGAVLAQAPSIAQSLLMLLDGIQPVGIGVYLLDPHGLTQSLGAIAVHNQVLPVQVKDSGVYINLGTVVSPLSDAKVGTPILKIRIADEDGGESRVEIKQGSLVSLPVRHGQLATLTIDTLHGTVLDPARPRVKSFKVIGGVCGVVIDARGRPVVLPASQTEKRFDLLGRWAQALENRRLV